ncbi:MAG TPA: hypothetical protein VGO52_00095 [Hyphomonadaceae bacterium]|jgi:hypothetical protein|nr:hypothetical protein [Hyphomonadaceae bacterium]
MQRFTLGLAGMALMLSAGVAAAQTTTSVVVAKDWLPTSAQADAALAAVKDYLSATDHPSQWAGKTAETMLEKRERAAVLRQYPSYSLRIMGKISSAQPALAAEVAGRKIIQINGFCNAKGNGWQSPGFLVMDGGACYFHADYDPQTGAIVWFGVNGEA